MGIFPNSCVIPSIPGYENQPEVLKLFKSSSTRSTEPKNLKREERQRKRSVSYLPGGLSPSRPRSTSVGGGREERKASAVPNNFLEELRKNEQFRSRLASL